MKDDVQHLRALSVCHYAYAGLTALISCLPLIHLTVGAFLLAGVDHLPVKDESDRAGLQIVGGFFVVIAAFAILVGFSLATMSFFAGRYLAMHRGYHFCFVAAVIECLNMPLGMVLGIFTIVVLVRPSVKQLFGVEAAGKVVA